jgi:EAL domain-containing protein (putative c-di-GMP-specific phosphodiesterase class I)
MPSRDSAAVIERVCCEAELETLFQPMLELESGECVAYEALTRFPDESTWSPRDWFANASELGLGDKLELAAIAAALGHLEDIPPRAALAVNVSPAVAITDEFFELVAPFAARLILELTEHEPIDDYDTLADRLHDLRELGARIAVDDVGAGFASVRNAFRLAPDIVKLDLSLTNILTSDAATRTVIAALVEYAENTGVWVAAEGIESSAALEQVRRLGIAHGQGFLLGRPSGLAVSVH